MAWTWSWRPVLALIIIFALVVYEEWVSTPSCTDLDHQPAIELDLDHPDDLKVMMVANLLLLGSEAGFFNLYFRDYYLSKFFRKSFESLKPDMLLVLGDVSAKGSELTKSEWASVLHQFHGLLGPFIDLPYHVILGDRDIGECSELNVKSINWITSNFPGLDLAGCGAFEISNISFVSLNAVALLCATEEMNKASQLRETDHNFGWKENTISSGSGPVLLLHFPLHQTADINCSGVNALKRTLKLSRESSNTLGSRSLVETGPYKLSQTLPLNATEYIFQALKPRIVFSAHTHEFCDQLHSDGTREVTVPAMTWNARDDPGFVVATFHRKKRAKIVLFLKASFISQASLRWEYPFNDWVATKLSVGEVELVVLLVVVKGNGPGFLKLGT
uniref:Calcineurin-like phosphoesterase domain-containing protein n=1 Tax=Fagus sylvatica TaxID=28930 RepID=A0A2N9ED52_FAGSY